MGNWMFFWYWVILDKGPLNGLLLCLIWNLAELLEYAKGPTGLYLRLTTMNLTVGGEISHWEWGLDASACTWLQHVHWHRQLWGTGARAPLDSSGLIFLLNFIAAQSLTATCAVASPNIFVFCDSSCDSSVAATRTVFSVLFHVMLCATKKFCVVLSPPPHTRSWRRHWACSLFLCGSAESSSTPRSSGRRRSSSCWPTWSGVLRGSLRSLPTNSLWWCAAVFRVEALLNCCRSL